MSPEVWDPRTRRYTAWGFTRYSVCERKGKGPVWKKESIVRVMLNWPVTVYTQGTGGRSYPAYYFDLPYLAWKMKLPVIYGVRHNQPVHPAYVALFLGQQEVYDDGKFGRWYYDKDEVLALRALKKTISKKASDAALPPAA